MSINAICAVPGCKEVPIRQDLQGDNLCEYHTHMRSCLDRYSKNLEAIAPELNSEHSGLLLCDEEGCENIGTTTGFLKNKKVISCDEHKWLIEPVTIQFTTEKGEIFEIKGIADAKELNLEYSDNVNNPKHYNSLGAVCSNCHSPIECIDVTRHLGFNIGNAIKYLWRHAHKNGTEDLRKAIWYRQDEINHREKD